VSSAATLVEICTKEELVRYIDNATRTGQDYARRLLEIRAFAQKQVNESEQEAALWALVVSKCDAP
jgi:hypothetical protein